MVNMGSEIKTAVLEAQREEITAHLVYRKLAERETKPVNREVLRRISGDEKKHYEIFRRFTERDVEPDRWALRKYYLLSVLFGLTFGIKLMERSEEKAQVNYAQLIRHIPDAGEIQSDGYRHQRELTAMIDEEKLKYVGSIVLGLNDALVELTGALAGFTFALQNTLLIAMVGLITGVSAALSMGASEYFSIQSEGGTQDPLKASLYTGCVYMATVFLLVLPYLLFSNYLFCLFIALATAVLLILLFTFYLSVVRDIPFRRRFIEMAGISLGVAALSFLIGYLVRVFLNVDI
ncbi:MAG TPA: VIT1/CCC1 transporter family protein [Syntrophales bacterium]|nr:VIT1/CCC1 transporter family protein [Syntrophales bacterium]